MEIKILQKIIKKKQSKLEFALITNLETSESEIFEQGSTISKNFQKHEDKYEHKRRDNDKDNR